MQSELWNDVLGYEGLYTVSNTGRLINLKTSKELFGTTYSHGYVVVCLSKDGVVKRDTLHAIVAKSFICPRPDGKHIDHIDGNRINNCAENLHYVTPAENNKATADRGATAKGSRNGASKLTEEDVVEIRAAKSAGGRYWGAKQLASKFGVTIDQIVKAGMGYTFKHVDCAAAIRSSK